MQRILGVFRGFGAFVRTYGMAISLMFLGIVLLVFLLNVNASQIIAIKSAGPEAEELWNTFSDILVVISAGFLSVGGMYIGSSVQNRHLKEQEIREIRRRITQEYRDYLTWILQIGQHSEFVRDTPKLREKLPEKGHQFDITPELRADIIVKMPLFWEFSSIDDNDARIAVNIFINDALEYLSIIGAEQQPDYVKLQQSYDVAMKTLNEFEIRF